MAAQLPAGQRLDIGLSVEVHAREARGVTAALVRPSRSLTRRGLEVLPTAAVWALITAPAWGALVAPAALGGFLILFSIYWLWKSLCFAAGVLIGFWRLHCAQAHDWLAEARGLP